MTVDLTNCDREPIHLIGSVQSFGFLLAVAGAEWRVCHASRNATEWLRAQPEEMLGQPLDTIFTAEAVHAIRGHFQAAVMGDTVARAFGVALTDKGLRCDLAVHSRGDAVVIECEPTVEEPALNSAAAVTGMMARLQQTADLRAFYRVAAREMRALTGFDRVMVYRFEHDGSGEVIAEAARAGLESYLGLHYPASDIPRQARILYERNWLRIIPDIHAAPSPIEPGDVGQDGPLDLSMSVLRSVSPIHIEYLRNMGVGASMSVSILRHGKLWGLFACHHYAPHHVPFNRRTAAELFGQMFSLLAENRERESESVYEARAQKQHQQLIAAMAGEVRRIESVIAHLDDIADLLPCDGIAAWVDGRAAVRGVAPDAGQLAALVAHLDRRDVGGVHTSYEIAAEHPPARAFAGRAAGMLVIPLSRPSRDYLIFFRREVSRSVNWAGDPNKAVTVGPLGDRLTPRKSFELWRQTVNGQSLPWSAMECRIAEALRVSLLEVILHLTDLSEEERRRAVERQDLLIAELNHRVRNILSLIRGVITQSRDSGTTVDSFTKIVGGRIHALALAHDQITADNWGPASFRNLVNAEAGAYLGGKADRVVVNGADVLIEPAAFTTVALVIHEMLTNSAKYGALSDSRGRVRIDVDYQPEHGLRIEWSEHGGPPVQPPLRRGFGSTVIERSIRHDLKGEAQVEYALLGVRARFRIPANHARLSEGDSREGGAPVVVQTPASPMPRDVLVVEDNMIIALDAEDMLRELGVATVRSASGVAEALKAIADHPPDFALLDINLGSETSLEVAEMLLRRNIRFAFTTGYGEQIDLPAEYERIAKARKPYTRETLRGVLEV